MKLADSVLRPFVIKKALQNSDMIKVWYQSLAAACDSPAAGCIVLFAWASSHHVVRRELCDVKRVGVPVACLKSVQAEGCDRGQQGHKTH